MIRAVVLSLLMALPAQALTFDVEGDTAYVEGEIKTRDLRRVKRLLDRNPQLETLVLVDVPGSNDDETNAQIIRLIRRAGLATHLEADSFVASGGTDLFLAGKRRTMERGAQVGVHSWAKGDREGKDFPKSDPAHRLFLDLYKTLGIAADFYWFTLSAAPAGDMHFMSEAEIARFGLLTAPVGTRP